MIIYSHSAKVSIPSCTDRRKARRCYSLSLPQHTHATSAGFPTETRSPPGIHPRATQKETPEQLSKLLKSIHPQNHSRKEQEQQNS